MSLFRLKATLARISHHGFGRAGLQPRRYKAFVIILVSRALQSPRRLRGTRRTEGGEPRFRRG
jgi:hypothetical protein